MLLIGYCAHAQYPTHLSGFVIQGRAQGTTYSIKYYGEIDQITNREIDSLLTEIDHSMSTYNSNSLISTFNSPETRKIKMDKHMINVLKASYDYHKLTKGFFDVTVYPLLKLWGFGPNGYKRSPSLGEIDSVRNLIGMRNLRLRNEYLIKRRNNISIDLNGIAQGYTVDQLAILLESKGIENYLVELGGEIRTRGNKPEGPFVVEVQRPNNSKPSYRIRLQNVAITTSGSYEKQIVIDGKKVSHHMNPLTAEPLINNIISATVIAKTAMEADALDNFFMYLSPAKAIEMVEKLKDVEIYLIYFENNTYKELQSSGFYNYIY